MTPTGSRPPVGNVINRIIDPWFVWAPAPEDRTRAVKLFADPNLMAQLRGDHRATAYHQYFGHILGKTSFVDQDGSRRTIADVGILEQSIALFRGLLRPFNENGDDKEGHIFVSNPKHDYAYNADRTSESGRPLQVVPPHDSIFATFVRFGEEIVAPHRQEIKSFGGNDVGGIIVGWEWTFCAPSERSLPNDFATRYDERIW